MAHAGHPASDFFNSGPAYKKEVRNPKKGSKM